MTVVSVYSGFCSNPHRTVSILDNRKNTLTTKAFCIAYMPDIEHPVGQFGFDSYAYH